MRYLKYLVLLAVVAVPAIHSQAQVSIHVQIGPSYGYYHPEPVCVYGYYPYYPFGCAPYGYWGPQWFVDGVFIGAGPWYHFYYLHPEYHRAYWRFRNERFEHFREREVREGRFRGASFRGGDRGFHGGDRGFRGSERFRRGEGHFHGRGESHRHGDRR